MQNILNMLGLARRARAIECGARLCSEAVKKHRAELVIIASDASDTTKKEIKDCCTYYKTEFIEMGMRESIGAILGTGECSAAAVTDKNFAAGIRNKYHERKGE